MRISAARNDTIAMMRVRGTAAGARVCNAALWLCGLGIAAACIPSLQAQDAPPTLHVYTNLVQIPTLVLQADRKPLAAPLAEGRFFVSFDGGPKFRATHARLEGDDPINLSILLDLRQPFPSLMDGFGIAAAALPPRWLTANDRVSIYSAGCRFVRSGADVPADAKALEHGVQQALQAWKTQTAAHAKADCPAPSNLWDSLAAVEQATLHKPGRNAVLVVSDGLDLGSKTTWDGVREFAQQNGIAIFGLIQPDDLFAAAHSGFPSTEDTFSALCERTGGMLLVADEKDLGVKLEQFTSLLRGRYIVEFPRPFSTAPGKHQMVVTVDRSDVLALPTGIDVPVDDPVVLNDPTTVPRDPASAPQLGKGR